MRREGVVVGTGRRLEAAVPQKHILVQPGVVGLQLRHRPIERPDLRLVSVPVWRRRGVGRRACKVPLRCPLVEAGSELIVLAL